MEFFLDLLLTAVLALLFSFLVAKLVSISTPGDVGGNYPNSDHVENPEIGVDDYLVTEELRFGFKMDARVVESESSFGVVDENIELVDRFENEDHLIDGIPRGNAKVPAKGEDLVVLAAEAESSVAFSPDNVIAEELIVREPEEGKEICAEREELMVPTMEAESTVCNLPENVVAEESCSEEKRSESTDTEPKKEETNSAEESCSEEVKEELTIEEDDDDWEGIERSELEKAFAAAAKLLEASGKAEEIGGEAKMELYGLHKIATEGPCRETQPMAVMVSARAKWNAWKRTGNMSQEEAMEQYLALISKEIPSLMDTVAKLPKNETFDKKVLPP